MQLGTCFSCASFWCSTPASEPSVWLNALFEEQKTKTRSQNRSRRTLKGERMFNNDIALWFDCEGRRLVYFLIVPVALVAMSFAWIQGCVMHPIVVRVSLTECPAKSQCRLQRCLSRHQMRLWNPVVLLTIKNLHKLVVARINRQDQLGICVFRDVEQAKTSRRSRQYNQLSRRQISIRPHRELCIALAMIPICIVRLKERVVQHLCARVCNRCRKGRLKIYACHRLVENLVSLERRNS